MPIWYYSTVLLIPILAFAGIGLGGIWTWLIPIVIFGFIPVIEHGFEGSTTNIHPREEENREQNRLARVLLLGLLPLQLA